MRTRLATTLVLALTAMAGCGDDDSDRAPRAGETADPAAAERAPVARVGQSAISRATYYHWEQIALHQENGCGKSCRKQAMRFLLTARWVLQEAAARGVTVSDRELRRIDMLTKRLERVARRTNHSARDPLQSFVKRFYRKYRARTACKPAYTVRDLCGRTLTA